ncbi:hypothetical protein LYB30171_01732 [Lysobacter luteus]|uniref:Spore coat protein U/FanG domain-containing protein n=1 Tax=Novilysobacter luteus TaxID=2822368 RepID=A0ABM8UGB8_9GAMM|nr:hypothetical protein LYB30171_01732 [Lysobacter luteus]
MAPQARAESLVTDFDVYLDVAASCSFTGTKDIAFGNRAVVPGQQLEASGYLKVRCNVPVAYKISLDDGLHGSGISDRRMKASSGDTIAYQLYSGNSSARPCSSAGGVQWGDASGGCIYNASFGGTEQSIPVLGRLTIDDPGAGSYSDTITATITY